jgi:hypothetical protein
MTCKVAPLILFVAMLSAGCGDPAAPIAVDAHAGHSGHDTAQPSKSSADHDDGSLLVQIKQATARYHRLDAALDDGFVRNSSCASSVFGGKGVSFLNAALADGVIDPSAPEMLNYEPAKNGKLRLASVAFIVRASAWDPFHTSAPTLDGQAFVDRRAPGSFGPAFPHYALFVSVWEKNPAGTFEQYNANVSCEYADDAVVELIRATTTGRPVYPLGNTAEGGQGLPIAGLACIGGPPGTHVHGHVSLFVRGEQIAIPAGIGITNPVLVNNYVVFDRTKCFYEMHTHDASGIIHLHANANHVGPLTLGQLFALWGRTLSRTEIAGNVGPVTAYVNQQLYTGALADIVLMNHTQVTLEVGGPLVKPPTYVFPTNP